MVPFYKVHEIFSLFLVFLSVAHCQVTLTVNDKYLLLHISRRTESNLRNRVIPKGSMKENMMSLRWCTVSLMMKSNCQQSDDGDRVMIQYKPRYRLLAIDIMEWKCDEDMKWKKKTHAENLTAVLRSLHYFMFFKWHAGGAFRGSAKGVRLCCLHTGIPHSATANASDRRPPYGRNVRCDWRWTRKIQRNEKASLKDTLWFIRVGKLESTWQIPLISYDFHERFWTP